MFVTAYSYKAKSIGFQAILLSLVFWFSLQLAYADNDFVVYSPNITEGLNEVEVGGFDYRDVRDALNNANGVNVSIAHTVNDWWKPELYIGQFSREPGMPSQLTGYEFENTFQLTDPGEYWADVGLLLSYGYEKLPGITNHLELGLLLEKRTGRFNQRFNFVREKYMGKGAASITSSTTVVTRTSPSAGKGKGKGGGAGTTTSTITAYNAAYAPGGYPTRASYSASYKFDDLFMPGIEAYYHADDNGVQYGPVIYGEIKSSSGSELEYSIGLLFATNTLYAPSKTWVARLGYDFF